eukprot:m.152103 g.152103  ORF g.152103 m.152103 type:complete len:441 (-) comp24535_c0_seq1:49-1371(-)
MFLLVLLLGVGAHAVETPAPLQTKSRVAWHDLLDTLKMMDEQYLSPVRKINSDIDIAEGHLHFLNLLTAAFKTYVSTNEKHPEMLPLLNGESHLKYLFDNPDAYYLGCPLDPNMGYILRGTVTHERYISITLYSSKLRGGFVTTTVNDVNHLNIKYDSHPDDTDITMPDGLPVPGATYTIYIGPNPPRPELNIPNYLKTDTSQPNVVFSRHYIEGELLAVHDKAALRDLTLNIETEEPQPPSSTPTDDDVSETITTIKNFMLAYTIDKPPAFDPSNPPAWMSSVPNVIPKAIKNIGSGGATDLAYAFAPWKLAPGEGLLFRLTMPRVTFFNVILYNRYFQSLDYGTTERRRSTSLNRAQMKHSDTDEHLFFLSATKPEVDVNFLDTQGRPFGFMFFRYILPLDELTVPKAEVIKVEEVAAKVRKFEQDQLRHLHKQHEEL